MNFQVVVRKKRKCIYKNTLFLVLLVNKLKTEHNADVKLNLFIIDSTLLEKRNEFASNFGDCAKLLRYPEFPYYLLVKSRRSRILLDPILDIWKLPNWLISNMVNGFSLYLGLCSHP